LASETSSLVTGFSGESAAHRDACDGGKEVLGQSRLSVSQVLPPDRRRGPTAKARAITGRIVCRSSLPWWWTPEGLPLAYEVLPGNTADKTTLRRFLDRIERQYGKARRIWLMDRGAPTEEVLADMRGRPASALSGGHAKGSPDAFGKASDR
jgi:hypothetical protein